LTDFRQGVKLLAEHKFVLLDSHGGEN